MTQSLTDDLRIHAQRPLITPNTLKHEIPLTSSAIRMVQKSREDIFNIIQGKDHRLLIVVGPCSIHDSKAALEYADLLKESANHFIDDLYIVMRVYFAKPRTSLGWKGLINDPLLNESFDINLGLKTARTLLANLAEIGLPAGTEFLDTFIPQYLSDLVSWSAIGARTSQSQLHRELASGLSMPVGFKNSTDGNIKVAIDAVHAAQHPHHFLSITKDGMPSIISTMGNDACHIILRGSSKTPNYLPIYIEETTAALQHANLIPKFMVDCSHGNSQQNHCLQSTAADSLAEQIKQGSQAIFGIMLESNLVAGKQILQQGKPLTYGQSITDACISWNETLPLLEKLAMAVRKNK